MANSLCYRGVQYFSKSTEIQTIETEVKANFLGGNYQVRRPVYQPNQKKLNLVYRGVSYSTDNSNNGFHPNSSQDNQKSEFVGKLAEQLGL